MATMQDLWERGPRLLVPIAVEALVVNANDQWFGTWSVMPNHYQGFNKLEPFQPHPFERDDSHVRRGITIRWALPDALTHGRPGEKGSGIEFPFIPDRWLVLRTHFKDAEHSYRAWVVDSDYLDEHHGANPYLKDAALTRIGRSRLLWPTAEWQEEEEPATPHLTALGPGEPGFAAYIAHNDDVLSFYDSLSDLVENASENDSSPADLPEEEATFSYLVAGWYAYRGEGDGPHLDQDPLALRRWRENGVSKQALWLKLLKQHKWSLGGRTADVDRAKNAAKAATGIEDDNQIDLLLPAQIICHGLVYEVNWTGKSGSTQSGVPSMEPQLDAPKTDVPHIAIGNSLNDALAAMLEYLMDQGGDDIEAADVVKQIMAIESGQMETFDGLQGEVTLDQALHKEWFAPEDGGTRWEIVPARSDPSTLGSRTGTLLTADQKAALEALNHNQQALDTAVEKLRATQDELYTLWWKHERLKHLSEPDRFAIDSEALKTVLDQAIQSALDAKADVKEKQDKLDGTADQDGSIQQVTSLLDPDKHQLMSRALPRYWRPNDPTVLIFGGQQSTAHGRDGRYMPDGSLFCRFSGQTVSALGNATREAIVSQENEVFAALKELKKHLQETKALPYRDIIDLIVECVFLDPSYAVNLAPLVAESATVVASDQRGIWALPDEPTTIIAGEQELAEGYGFVGLIPSRHGISAWSPPWSPLFMSWQVTFYPTGQNPEQIIGSDSWFFNPYNGLEYDWVGAGLPDHGDILTIQGRSMLARTDLTRLRDNLEAIALAQGEGGIDRSTLNDMQDQMATADLLSQTLTGFHDQLLMRQQGQGHYPPDDFVRANGEDVDLQSLIGDIKRLAPMAFGAGSGRTPFYPLRAGHLRLNRIWIIDCFGQVFDPIRARGETMSSFVPLRGYGLSTVGGRKRGDTQVLQLAPRVVQPSRLDFRFVSAEFNPQAAGDPSQETDPEAGNPLCGWLLPNHLDRSLAVYDASGDLLGAVLESAAVGVSWRSAAGDVTPAISATDIPNPYLAEMISALLPEDANDVADRDEKVAAFKGLRQVIDRTLWSSDPLGDRPQKGIAHLIGRPIAVARARLGLQLKGDPATIQLWSETIAEGEMKLKRNTADFENVSFPIQLGDLMLRGDGTLGYFKDSDAFSKFYPVYPDVDTLNTPYLAFSETFDQLQVKFGDEPLYLTLLLDPRGKVFARTGILPTKALTLPAAYVDDPLARMAVTFRIGPVLTEPTKVRLPLPAEVHGSWRWLEKSGVDLGAWEELEIDPAGTAPNLDTLANTIRDGWLKLNGNGEVEA